jgi:hypothetical protein
VNCADTYEVSLQKDMNQLSSPIRSRLGRDTCTGDRVSVSADPMHLRPITPPNVGLREVIETSTWPSG